MSKVKIFSTSWCAYCRAEKQFLDAHNIPYQDVDVEADSAEAEAMIKLSGQMGVPVTLITHDDDQKVVIVGFDQARLAHELKLH